MQLGLLRLKYALLVLLFTSGGYTALANPVLDLEPDAPVNLVVTEETEESFLLSWEADDEAVGGFNVFIASGTTTDIFVGTVEEGGSSFRYTGTYTDGDQSVTIMSGETYTVTVQALPDDNFNAFSSLTFTLESSTGDQEPGAPTGLTITNETTSGFTINWDNDPSATGGYNIFISSGSVGNTFVGRALAGATSFDLDGTYGNITIMPGGTYTVTLQALPDEDLNAFSTATVTLMELEEDPGPPEGLFVTEVTENSFVLNWVSDPNARDGYNIFLSEPTGDTYITTLPAGANSFLFTGTYGDITIAPGGTYTPKIQALPDPDFNAFSQIEVTLPDGQSEEPTAPTGLTISEETENSFLLSWVNDPLAISGYDLYLSTTTDGEEFVANVPAGTTSFRYVGSYGDITLSGGNTYTARIQALPDTDNNASASATTTLPEPMITEPGAPAGLTISQETENSFLLSWLNDPLATGGYDLYLSTTTDGEEFVVNVPAGTTSFRYVGSYGDITLSGGNTYTARIQALPDVDNNASASATTTLPEPTGQEPGAPAGLTISQETENSFLLTWVNDPLATGGYDLYLSTTTDGEEFVVNVPAGTTSFRYVGFYGDITLSGGNTYTARIQALPDTDGNASASATTTLPEPTGQEPGAPADLTISQETENSFLLSWVNDPLATSGYDLYLSTAADGEVFVANVSAGTTSFRYVGTYGGITLSGGNTYTARIQALPDTDGNASASATTTLPEPMTEEPDAPAGLTISEETENSFLLSWVNDPLATGGYDLYLSTTADGEVFVANVSAGTTSFRYVGSYGAITLSGGNTYMARIQALPDTDSNASASATTTLPEPTGQEPGAPAGLVVSEETENSFLLSWVNDPLATGGYDLFISTATDAEVFVINVAAGTTSYRYEGSYGDITLVGGEAYTARIQALPDADGNASALAIATLPEPAIEQPAGPDSLRVTDRTEDTFTITWEDDILATDGYNIFIASETGGAEVFVATLATGSTTYTFTGTYGSISIEAGGNYTARVQALPDADSNAFSSVNVELGTTSTSFVEQASLKVYPNPASDFVRVETNSRQTIASIQLVDQLGRPVLTKTTDLNQIDVSALPYGNYVLVLRFQNGRVLPKRLTVVR